MRLVFEAHDCELDIYEWEHGIGTIFECELCKSLWKIVPDKQNGRKVTRLTENNEQGVPFNHPMEVLARN